MTMNRIGAFAALLALLLAGCVAQRPEPAPVTSATSAAAEPVDDPAAALAERKRLTKPMPLAPGPAAAASIAPTAAQPEATKPKAASTAKPKATPKMWPRAQCENASQADRIDNCRQYGYGLSKTATAKPKVVAPVPGTPLPRNAPPMDWDGCKPASYGPPEVACR